MIVILPVVFLLLLLRGCPLAVNQIGAVGNPSRKGGGVAALAFAIGAVLTLLLVFLPFVITAPKNILFGLVEYHSGRDVGGFGSWIMYRAGFVSRVVRAYFVAFGLGFAILLWRFIPGVWSKDRADVHDNRMDLLIWASILAVTLVHLAAPFPYDDYQVAIFPLFAVALASVAIRLPQTMEKMSWVVLTVFVLSLVSAFSSPMNQEWFVKERDRIWWRMKEKTTLRELQEVGARLRKLSGADGRILTQDTYLAVEAGLSVPAGLEMGPFSFYPELDEQMAKERHVVNRGMMIELLRSCDAHVAAFSGYGLTIASPGVVQLPRDEQRLLWRTLLERYRVVDEIENFGQALTTLTILVRKDLADTGAGSQSR